MRGALESQTIFHLYIWRKVSENGVREKKVRCRRLGPMSGKNGAAERERSTEWSTAKLTKSPMQRPVLEDLGS